MKKFLVVLLLIVSIVCSTFTTPIATAESGAYQPPNAMGQVTTEENTGEMNRVPVNNSNTIFPLCGGVACVTSIEDNNKDGYLDIVVSGQSVSENGHWIFYGTPESQDPESPNYMFMGEKLKYTDFPYDESGVRLEYDADGNYLYTADAGNGYINYGNGTTIYFVDPETEEYFPNMRNPLYINGDKVTAYKTIENPTARLAKSFRTVDFDGDGVYDLIYDLQDWGEYGNIKVDKWSDDGVWGDDNQDGVVNKADPDHDLNGDGKIDANDVYEDTNGDGVIDENDALCGDGDNDPAHGWLMFYKNYGTDTQPIFMEESVPIEVWDYEVDAQGNKTAIPDTNRALDVQYGGGPAPAIWDFDGDGDLDLMCGSSVGYVTYFENIGSRTNPIYIDEQLVYDNKGNQIMSDNCSLSLFNCDWNEDGLMDVIMCVAENGRVYLIEHTGKYTSTGMPIFTEKKPFLMYGDSLKFECISSPYSIDWDNDGDEDLIVGDSGGWLQYIPNITIEKALEKNPNMNIEDIDLSNPSWGDSVRLKTPDDEEFSVKMRDYGYSTQGPTEDNYGYTIPTVVDWDMDGVLDIVLSSANSRIIFLKGIAGDIYHIEYPQFIEAEFMGKTPKPSWLWWEPQGKEICVLWRTTPNVVDLPLDEDGDGVAEGDGLMDLVLIDHEGILSFYQRYRDRDGSLKLKEGKRIFKLNGFIWQVVNIPGGDAGKWGWRMVDWDCDGDLDVIMQGGQYEGSVYFMENISTTPGEYNFVNRGHVHPRVIRCHEVHVSTCDWNKDGIPDILCGDISGNVYYYLNDLSKN